MEPVPMKAVPAPFDISQYELENEAELTVQDPRGNDLIGADGENPVVIVVYGTGTPQGVKALHRAGMQLTKRMQEVVRGKIDKRAAEIADEERVEKLVAFTKAIKNFPLSAEEIYRNPSLNYITKQVEAFIDNDANFTKPSTTK